jgi:glycerophosphoryl diester phosphodiesterase
MSAGAFDVASFAYAHRGLWGGEISENSVPAFRAAAAAGVGVELDVRMTRDGELVVFHDATLERMCQSPKEVAEINFVELRGHRLPDGSRIPTLREALEAMGGLPALIEVKIDPPNRRILPVIIEYMTQQTAAATLMSFDEPSVWRMATLMPKYQVGQLIEPVRDIGADGVAIKAARAREAGCAYLAPHHSSLTATPAGLPRVTWTVRTEKELGLARKHGAAPIFEGFSADLAKPEGTPI